MLKLRAQALGASVLLVSAGVFIACEDDPAAAAPGTGTTPAFEAGTIDGTQIDGGTSGETDSGRAETGGPVVNGSAFRFANLSGQALDVCYRKTTSGAAPPFPADQPVFKDRPGGIPNLAVSRFMPIELVNYEVLYVPAGSTDCSSSVGGTNFTLAGFSGDTRLTSILRADKLSRSVGFLTQPTANKDNVILFADETNVDFAPDDDAGGPIRLKNEGATLLTPGITGRIVRSQSPTPRAYRTAAGAVTILATRTQLLVCDDQAPLVDSLFFKCDDDVRKP